MRLLSLNIENVRRIKAVHIDLKPRGITMLGGKNKQGKTSALDSFEMLVGGADTIPDTPIHRGAEFGRIVGDFDEVVITRTFAANGSKIKIEAKIGADGRAVIPTPQTWLDERFARLALDPLEFMQMKPEKQAETLRRLTGIDTRAMDAERLAVYNERTGVNGKVRDAQGALRDMPRYADAPAEPVTMDLLNAELADARAKNAAKREATDSARVARDAVKAANVALADHIDAEPNALATDKERIEAADRAVKEAEDALTRARAAAESFREMARENSRSRFAKAETLRLNAVNAVSESARLESIAGAMPDGAEDAVLTRFGEVNAINAKVAANAAHVKASIALQSLTAKSAELTARIDKIDADKVAMLSAAPFPVPGLSFSESGSVTFNGLSLDEASDAEKIQVSTGIALALNPTCKLALIRNASLLDDDSLAIIAEMCEAADAQVMMERVGTADVGAIIIEDGEVVSAPAPVTTGALL